MGSKAPDQFYRPLLMSIEMSRPKTKSCCTQSRRNTAAMPPFPCPTCDGTPPPHMAYAMSLGCTGNNACGCCGLVDKQGNGGGGGNSCSGGGSPRGTQSCSGARESSVHCVRLPGQGPCDPPCFSTMVFPRYAPFVPEGKCPTMPTDNVTYVDICSMAPVGGTSEIGAHYRSCFSCNTCNVGGRMDVCNRSYPGANNSPCFPMRKSNSCSSRGGGGTW